MTYRYDNLKERAAVEFHNLCDCSSGFPTSAAFQAFCGAIEERPYRHPGAVLKEWIAAGEQIIANWDIRECMKLVRLFPSCLPKHLHGRRPVCGYDERGNWVLDFP